MFSVEKCPGEKSNGAGLKIQNGRKMLIGGFENFTAVWQGSWVCVGQFSKRSNQILKSYEFLKSLALSWSCKVVESFKIQNGKKMLTGVFENFTAL